MAIKSQNKYFEIQSSHQSVLVLKQVTVIIIIVSYYVLGNNIMIGVYNPSNPTPSGSATDIMQT